MTYENLLNDSLESLPEFEKEYQNNIKNDVIDKDAGMHVVFGFVFTPLLEKAISGDKTLAEKMFKYLEKMAASEDVRVQEVCDQSVIEVLYDNYPATKLWPLMQEKTREGYISVSQYMN